MKKSLFMLGLAVAAMTSCSNDELMEVNENSFITFENHVDNGTRAETTKAGLSQFYVFGNHGTTVDFENDLVKLTDGVWNVKQVAWTGNEYQFGAYATNNASTKINNASFTSGALSFPDYQVNQEHDLVAALTNVDNRQLGNQAVGLTFKHMLSKVKFTITNGSSENLTMKVSEIKFTVKNQGTCTYDNSGITWSSLDASKELEYAGTTSNVAKAASWTSADNLVIPGQALDAIKATFTVTFYNGADVFTTMNYTNVPLTLTSGSWQPGYIYNYTASPTPAMPYIQFQVDAVEGWNTTDDAL